MPLFGRKKSPKVTMSYAPGGPKVALVSTPGGPKPLLELVDWGWVSIAALARWGYQQHGRGAVAFKSSTGDMGYIAAEDIHGQLDPREGRAVCAGYDPDLQVVFIT